LLTPVSVELVFSFVSTYLWEPFVRHNYKRVLALQSADDVTSFKDLLSHPANTNILWFGDEYVSSAWTISKVINAIGDEVCADVEEGDKLDSLTSLAHKDFPLMVHVQNSRASAMSTFLVATVGDGFFGVDEALPVKPLKHNSGCCGCFKSLADSAVKRVVSIRWARERNIETDGIAREVPTLLLQRQSIAQSNGSIDATASAKSFPEILLRKSQLPDLEGAQEVASAKSLPNILSGSPTKTVAGVFGRVERNALSKQQGECDSSPTEFQDVIPREMSTPKLTLSNENCTSNGNCSLCGDLASSSQGTAPAHPLRSRDVCAAVQAMFVEAGATCDKDEFGIVKPVGGLEVVQGWWCGAVMVDNFDDSGRRLIVDVIVANDSNGSRDDEELVADLEYGHALEYMMSQQGIGDTSLRRACFCVSTMGICGPQARGLMEECAGRLDGACGDAEMRRHDFIAGHMQILRSILKNDMLSQYVVF
jgi:hypothetical protein